MDLSHLNQAQRAAVECTDGPVMILAGAGSGKTRTLVTRVQYLLEVMRVSPYKILSVTFSNKAAREMRERIAANNSFDMGALQVTTFHAFCARVLRIEAQYLGLSRNFTIYDTAETKTIIKNILGKRGISQKDIHPSTVQYYIEGLKNAGFYLNCEDPEVLDEVEIEDEFFDYFREYEMELHKSNAVDFGSLITAVLNLFENFPEVLERYQKKYQYVMVDEYQDTNRAQFKLINLIAKKNRNICVVGDEDQSIYSWRGADIRNILDFEEIFPDAQLIKLEQNYRSSKNIIEAASHVIANNENRKGKTMWTDNEQGDSIKILECQDDRKESEYIAGEIKKLVTGGVDPREIAVFYRTNAQSRLLEDGLRHIGIAYKVVAGIKFYERKEVKDMLAYMRCVANPKDSLAITRVINTPVRGIGARTLRKIEDEAIKLSLSLREMLDHIETDYEKYKHLRLSAKVRSGIKHFLSIVGEAEVASQTEASPSEIYEKMLAESGYLESLKREGTYESQARIENLDELFNAIKQYEENEENPSVEGFLETITLDSEHGDTELMGEVSLMTIHGSKGLEYEYVFLAGLEETVFPSYMSIEDGDQGIEEERRLFYVAMTRAMKRLYICFAQGRMLWGSVRFNGPSRFLDEIPDGYYTWENADFGKSARSSSKKKRSEFEDDDFSQVSEFEDEVTYVIPSTSRSYQYKFPEGTKIKHKLYGEGKILSAEGMESDEKVVIKFSDGTMKKFLVKFAPIERL